MKLNLKMYILNLFLSLVIFGCNCTMSVSVLQTTEMEEMISVDCDAESIKSCIETVTKDYYLFKKRKFITNITSVKNLFKTQTADSTCESLKNPDTLKYEVTDTGVKTCENNCCEKNKTNVKNYNERIPIVIKKLLKHADFNVQVEAICENVGECVWKKQKKIFECECKQNYRILVTKWLNDYLILFNENKERKNLEYFDSRQMFAGYMFLLKCQPETASEYLEWWVKQLQNFPMKNRQNTSLDEHNLHQRNEKTSASLCLCGRHNHGKQQTTNNNYCCFINNENGMSNEKTSTSLCLYDKHNHRKQQTTNNNYCCFINNENGMSASSSSSGCCCCCCDSSPSVCCNEDVSLLDYCCWLCCDDSVCCIGESSCVLCITVMLLAVLCLA